MPIERLDAQTVARENEEAGTPIEPGEAPHAVEFFECRGSPLHQRPQDDFGIAGGAEHYAEALELRSQLAVVVDLAVVHQHMTSVLAGHRLSGGVA